MNAGHLWHNSLQSLGWSAFGLKNPRPVVNISGEDNETTIVIAAQFNCIARPANAGPSGASHRDR